MERDDERDPDARTPTRWPTGATPAGTTPRCSGTPAHGRAGRAATTVRGGASWRTLSGGEQKRLVLEALLRGPDEVLLLDEPDNFLDVPGKRWLEERLRETHEDGAVRVSHDRELLDQTADRVVTVESGAATSWIHGGGFATYARGPAWTGTPASTSCAAAGTRSTQKLKELVLMYKQKAAYNDGMASRYQAAQTRLRKFEEAGPPEAAPREQDVRMRLQRRPDRQARGDLRASWS